MNRHLELIQVLRGLAIFLVMFFHANYMFNNSNGYSFWGIGEWTGRSGGLDLFLVISVAMIYYIYNVDIGVKSKGTKFLKKRLLKIIPLYWLATFGGFLLVFILPQLGDEKHRDIFNTLKSLFFLSDDPVVGVAWSLSHIILFYVIFSILIVKPRVVGGIISVWLLISMLDYLLIFNLPFSFLFAIENIEIWSGVLVAILIKKGYATDKRTSIIILVTGILVYLLIWFNKSSNQVALNYELICYCVGAMLIVYSVICINLNLNLRSKQNLTKTFSLFGNASYAVFLSHVQFLNLFIVLFNKFFSNAGLSVPFILVLIMIFTLLSGILVHIFVEKPLNSFIKNKNVSFIKLNKSDKIA